MPIMKPNYCSRSIVAGHVSNSTSNTSTISAPSTPQSYYHNGYFSSSPFIVYRSEKYDGPHARALKILRGYAKYYILVPVILIANRCKDAFYQVCGLLLLLVSSPLWILMIIGLFIFRRLRLVLIQRLCPNLVELANDNSYSTSEESLGIVNSIIWTKGRLDAHTLQKKFELLFMENHDLSYILKLRSVKKFGAKLWEFCSDFVLESHIVEAPSRFHNCPFVDEPLKELYRTGSPNKSILQKYVSFCVSSPLENLAPPWKIHIVPYISRDEGGVREKTCLVIRMHVALIKNEEVQRALRELFLTSAVIDKRKDDDYANDSEIAGEHACKEISNLLSQKVGYDNIRKRVKEMMKSHQIGFKIWVHLRLKQLEYHSNSKTVVLSIILVDTKDVIKRFLNALEDFMYQVWRILLNFVMSCLTIIQALAAMPMIILASFMRRSQFKRLGFQRSENNKNRKLISWSDLIYGDLAEEICEKTGTSSPENVIMMACSYALHDYYQQNNMPNPQKLGFTIDTASCTVRPLKSLKAIHIPSNVKNQPQIAAQELKNLEERIDSYPVWKILGLSYNLRYLNYIFPSWLANKVHRRIVSCYPFSFSHINLKSESKTESFDLLPVCQLYGELVEDFTFWPLPPLSDFGVSITLVQYTGKTRLFVMSPFQSLDTVLTHRCNQYLIKLAEDVGVDRHKIPYSRRTSPSSTSCSTPHPIYVNMVDNLAFRSNLRRSNSLITTMR